MELVRRLVSASASGLAAAGVHPVLARIYAARGIETRGDLDHSLARLPSFDALRGIGAAAERLADAIVRREHVVIVADYDADGATACAVAVRGIGMLGGRASFVVPNRFEDGYGLTPKIVDQALAAGPDLIITVDNGIASHAGVAAARARGVDVIVTDHHLPAATLPDTPWIVDPNQPGCSFVSKHLAGVGVAFYVLVATRAALRTRGLLPEGGPSLAPLLDLVALGTVADVVRLDRVNRTLVAQGLARLRAGRGRPGINALFLAAGRDVRWASAYDLGFVAGPRLNAAGRLADMSTGIRCLLAEDDATAVALAAELDRLNRERRDLEAEMHAAALESLAAEAGGEDGYTVCVYRPDFHQGVVGIVASRLKERLYRPAIVFAPGKEGELKGSGRSIAGFHLRDALDLVAKRAPGCIGRFGGHAFAAGLSVPEPMLPGFMAAFERVAREALSPADLRRTLDTDGPLAPEELDFDLARELGREVWGQGFPPPLFEDTFEVADQRLVADKHSRLQLVRPGQRVEAMLWNEAEPLPRRIVAAYRPELHEWNGSFALRLVLEHWQPGS